MSAGLIVARVKLNFSHPQPRQKKSHPGLVACWSSSILLLFSVTHVWPATNVYLTGVPDYDWFYGCMGTASGNLMGFWDRHGFPDFYTGKVNGAVNRRFNEEGIRFAYPTRTLYVQDMERTT